VAGTSSGICGASPLLYRRTAIVPQGAYGDNATGEGTARTPTTLWDILALVLRRPIPVEDLLSIVLHALAGAALYLFHFLVDVFGIMGDVILGLFRKEDNNPPHQL
jgi:hypothetical protein